VEKTDRKVRTRRENGRDNAFLSCFIRRSVTFLHRHKRCRGRQHVVSARIAQSKQQAQHRDKEKADWTESASSTAAVSAIAAPLSSCRQLVRASISLSRTT
jgi:hypothetical protein